MEEPSRRASRLTIAGATIALIAAGTGGFLLGRGTGEPPPAPPKTIPAPTPSPTPKPVLPVVQPPLGRAELIAAAASAADAFASGRPLPESVTAFAGRDFDLRLPFGCPGAPQALSGGLSLEYGEGAEALRVRAEPVSWAPEDWLPAPPEDAPEAEPRADAIEGFWIARPWTSSEACPPADPAAPAGQAAPGAPEQTLGIAQIFSPDDSRVGRRDGEAYQAVERIAPDAVNLSQGLHLRLRGKLASAPGNGPVLCRASAGARPVCLIVAAFDQVAIENPATRTTIATWDVYNQTAGAGGR